MARARTSPEGVAAFIYGDGTGAAADEKEQTAQEIAMEFTEEEREEIRRMKSSPQLYNQVSFGPSNFNSLVDNVTDYSLFGLDSAMRASLKH